MNNVSNDRQATISEELHFEGVGLHTGKKVFLKMKPAPVSTGIYFIRTDLKENPQIPADISFVTETTRGTTLGKDNVFVYTVEHVLAALWGLGVDNAFLELSSEEVPILDGSSFEFCKKLMAIGLKYQNKAKKYMNLEKTVSLKKDDMSIVAIPHDKLKISFTLEYDHPYLFKQSRTYEYSFNTFVHDISKARTFCFDHEIDFLREKNLIKGGDLSNAVVLTEKGVLNKTLLFEDEFVRHKILDMIGDLSLLGLRLNAHVIAIKSGHSMNISFSKKLKGLIPKKDIVNLLSSEQQNDNEDGNVISKNMISEENPLTVDQIKKIIPHRYPFLLVDKIVETDGVKTMTGIKNFTINEEFFQGHFPGHPIVPGVFILESLAQTAACLLLDKNKYRSKIAYFMGLDRVKFRKPVRPGDSLILKIEILRERRKVVLGFGRAYVGKELVAEGDFKFALVDPGN